MAEATCRVVTGAKRRNLREIIAAELPGGPFRHIMIKPNWVLHQTNAHFPIAALVTSARLIEETIEACLERYPTVRAITVGDAPLQTCEFDLMRRQSGLAEIAARYQDNGGVRIRFLDLRKERFRTANGFQVRGDCRDGDPRGYREVVLDERSYLEEISREAGSFRVSDYDPAQTAGSHGPGVHRYLIAASVLDADLFINMPKAKTHQKAGITGALKNLVGIVGQKACLVHYRTGTPQDGGDEFAPHTPGLVKLQVRWRERLQQKSICGFRAARLVWSVLKRLRGIQTEGKPSNLAKKTFFRAGGAWPGNDTIWRMIYDLNKIILYAPREGGPLAATPQRRYLAIVDGLVAGEGDGPLQPLPVEAGTLMVATDPFLADCVLARWMGFDHRRIPQLAHRARFADAEFGDFDPEKVLVQWDERLIQGLGNLPVRWSFRPAPGWESIREG